MWDPQECDGRVVLGMDGSQHALDAVAWAADYAANRNLGLTLLTAQEPMAHSLRELIASHDVDALLQRSAASVLERGAHLAQSQHPDLDVRLATVWDAPAPALIEVSAHAAVVVTSSRGLGGWSGLMLGSVTAEVVPFAHGPVIVIPHRMDSPRLAGVTTDTDSLVADLPSVAVSADAAEPISWMASGQSSAGEVVLGVHAHVGPAATWFAFEHAHRWGVGVFAVHGWAVGVDWQMPLDLDPTTARALREHHEVLIDEAISAASAEFPQVPVRRQAVLGSPVTALAKASRGARLLVVGSTVRGPVRGFLLGSTTLGVLQVAHCPVAVIRPQPEGFDPSAV